MADKKTNEAGAAKLLSNLMGSNADADDILALAQMLSPIEHGFEPGQPSLLRRAFTREGYGKTFSDAQLEKLADTAAGGRSKAWELANDPPLAIWVHESLRRKVEIRDMAHRACVAVEMAPKSALRGSSHYESGDFALALLERSRDEDLGMDPFLAFAKACGQDPASMSVGDGAHERRAILMARSPKAFEIASASKRGARENIDGSPLWSAMRDGARRRSDTALAEAIEAWAAIHETGAEDSRKLADYFSSLSSYGGEDNLKKRKDWHEIVDPQGRTAMMAVAQSRSASIKAWWEIKKAHPGAAKLDHEGRSLWHYLLAKAKDAPSGCAGFLKKVCPPALDKQGRGLIPSLYFMREDGRMSSEHEWLFTGNDLICAAKGVPDAHIWFACEDASQAKDFGHWLANERYLGSSNTQASFAPALSRSVEQFASLAMMLDPASLQSVPAPIAGALAYNLAIAPNRGGGTSHTSHTEAVQACVGRLLAAGGNIELCAEREALLDKYATSANASMIRQAFEAAKQSQELKAHLPDPPEDSKAAPRRI